MLHRFVLFACRARRRSAPISGLIALTLLMALGGCGPQAAPDKKVELPLAGVSLKLLVVGDEPLAKAIKLLHGQWEGETGSKLAVESIAEQDLATQAAAGALPADALIYAPRSLGMLAEAGAIQPLAPGQLADAELDWADIFELVKAREVTWGTQVYAIPLGSPALVCFYREDLLQAAGRQPPRNWQEYQELAALFAARGPAATGENAKPGSAGDEKSGDWSGTIEPLAPGWAGLTLLARAAAYARHANHYSTLFNMQSMEPLVASPPFVRALEELLAAARLSPPAMHDATPADAYQAVLNNRIGMALCWPKTTANETANENDLQRSAQTLEIGCVEIPGSQDVYNATTKAWERRAGGSASVPLLGVAGRMGSITTQSPHAEGAFRLLAWLASRQWNERAVAANGDTAPFRASQVADAQAWSRGLRVGEAKQYATAVAATFSATDCLLVPRLPGADRYLRALDDAVRQALAGKATSAEALEAAAAQFRTITAELGVDRQRKAYQQSLGL